jgi:pSer/pThr/pTyr-binding forkhead associated (FHA) protein
MSYWCSQQLVVTLDGPAGRTEHVVPQPFARVGSDPQADVVIDDESVAPRCLYLHATDEGVFCLYLDVDAEGIEGKGAWLAPDSAIPLGAYRLQARLSANAESGPPPTESLAAWGSAPPPVPLVMIYCGRRLKDKRRFRARLSAIGRRPQCSLQLKGEKVSGFHCVLYWEHEQLWCVDLGSSNGTQLNGSPLVCQRVAIGDRLDVGEFGLVFLRLSNRPLVTSPDTAASQPGADVLDPSAGQPASKSVLPASTEESTIVASPADEHTILSLPQFPANEPARDSEPQHPLLENWKQEFARLADEREQMHRQWAHSSQQLQLQVSQLHDEAARLSGERQAFEQSRRLWHEEQLAASQELAQRASQLARIEAFEQAGRQRQAEQFALADQVAQQAEQFAQLKTELAAATAALGQTLAQVQRLVSESTASAGPSSPSAEELARQAEERQLRGQWTTELAALSREREALQSQWERSSEQLLAQINQLREQSAHANSQRQSLEQSRNEWHEERKQLAEQLQLHSSRLSDLEGELSQIMRAVSDRVVQVERSNQDAVSPRDTAPLLPAMPFEEIEPSLTRHTRSVMEPPTAPSERTDPAPAEDIPSAPNFSAVKQDQLPLVVSDRLLDLDRRRGRNWLWWSAGGVGVAAAVALVVTILLWVF